MRYHLVEKDAFSVFGKSLQVSVKDGQCFRDIPAFWAASEADGTTRAIVQAGGGDDWMMLSSAMYDHSPDGTFQYMICMDMPEGPAPAGFERLDVPAQTWAVFTTEEGEGEAVTAGIHDIWKRIHPEWFPSSGYEHAKAPDMERSRRTEGDRFIGEAWVPIVKAQRA